MRPYEPVSKLSQVNGFAPRHVSGQSENAQQNAPQSTQDLRVSYPSTRPLPRMFHPKEEVP